MDQVSILGINYTIVDNADLPEEEGVCDPATAEIRISKDVPPARRWSVLAHEIGHAVALESGFRRRLEMDHHVTGARALEMEETMLEHFLPGLIDTLQRAGWLTPPKGTVKP